MTQIQLMPDDTHLKKLATTLFEQLDGHIIMGIPIGIGKSTALVNALYQVAIENPTWKLDIHTALSLSIPATKNEWEARLLKPFFERQFKGVPSLDYVSDGKQQTIPSNIRIVEFYFKPGEMLNNPTAQQNALSANYTHVARDMVNRNINLVTQMISKQQRKNETCYSLSSNPDITLDLQKMMREKSAVDGRKRLLIAQVNTELPFMPNDAEVSADFFDHIVDREDLYTPLFCTPYQPISPTDHMIGFYTSTLIKDAGTLQIGIGSLGDAVVNALLVRQNHNDDYRQLLNLSGAVQKFPVINHDGGWSTFEQGLYGNTEMLVPGYLALKKGGVLKRKVYDDETLQTLVNRGLDPNNITLEWIDALLAEERVDVQLTERQTLYLQRCGLFNTNVSWSENTLSVGDSTSPTLNLNDSTCRQWLVDHALGDCLRHPMLIHAGFFVGNAQFYEDLRQMPEDQLAEINMTSVDFTNQMLNQERLKLAQRHHARFINACMKTTLAGASVSDGLANGQVVSGVGGQFNFVAMARDIPEARSILMMRASRLKNGKTISNIVYNYGHITIPRHMRDIIITEYGIADLRSKNDQEIIEELLKVADSRFQKKLIRQAQAAGKLPKNYQLPEQVKNNTPEAVSQLFQEDIRPHFAPFPFGKELTDQEVILGGALKGLQTKADRKWPLLSSLLKPLNREKLEKHSANMERMGLLQPKNFKERVFQKLLLNELPD